MRVQCEKKGRKINGYEIVRKKCGKALDNLGKMCFNLHRVYNLKVMYY